MSGLTVGLVGCEEVGGDAFKLEGRLGAKPREEGSKSVEICALTAHAGVDFEMDGKGADAQVGGMGGGFQVVDLREFPYNGGEAVLDDGGALAGEDACQHDDARVGTQGTRDDALFHAGDGD